jgi:hypothetical protein
MPLDIDDGRIHRGQQLGDTEVGRGGLRRCRGECREAKRGGRGNDESEFSHLDFLF